MKFKKLVKELKAKFIEPSIGLDCQEEGYTVTYFGANADKYNVANFRFTINKEVVLSWPKDFIYHKGEDPSGRNGHYKDVVIVDTIGNRSFMYFDDSMFIIKALGEYMNIPKEKIIAAENPMKEDYFGIFYLLCAADKRVGRNTLLKLMVNSNMPQEVKTVVDMIVEKRMKG